MTTYCLCKRNISGTILHFKEHVHYQYSLGGGKFVVVDENNRSTYMSPETFWYHFNPDASIKKKRPLTMNLFEEDI